MNQIISKSHVVKKVKMNHCPTNPSRAGRGNMLLYFKKPTVIMRDGRYALYDNGIICDCYSALEWLCGPDDDTSWIDAAEWVGDLTVGGGGGWRLPAI